MGLGAGRVPRTVDPEGPEHVRNRVEVQDGRQGWVSHGLADHKEGLRLYSNVGRAMGSS